MNDLRLPAAALLLGLLPGLSPACMCMQPKPFAERRLEYPTVFHGEAIDIGWDETRQLRWIRFEVIKDYSVQVSGSDSITVWTTAGGSLCGVDYPVGTEVLVFAGPGFHLPAGAVQSGLCQGNASGAGLQPALDAMEAALGVHAGRRPPGLRRERTRFEYGQVLFEGNAQANGVLRNGLGNR